MFSAHKCDSCKKTDIVSVIKCMKARKEERMTQSIITPISLDLDADDDPSDSVTNVDNEQNQEDEEDKENSVPPCSHEQEGKSPEECMNPGCTRRSIEEATPLRKDMCPVTPCSSSPSRHVLSTSWLSASSSSDSRQPLAELSFRAPSLMRRSSVCKKLFVDEEEEKSSSLQQTWQEGAVGMASSPLQVAARSRDSSSDDSFERFLEENNRKCSPATTNTDDPIVDFIVSDNSTISECNEAEQSESEDLQLCRENFVLPTRTRYGGKTVQTKTESVESEEQHTKTENKPTNLLYWTDSESEDERERFGRSHEDIEEEEESNDDSSRSSCSESDGDTDLKSPTKSYRTEKIKSLHRTGQCSGDSSKFVEMSFLSSLSLDIESQHRHPDAIKYVKSFKFHKNELIARLFKLYNREVFAEQLPHDFAITWSKRLTKTAGFCRYLKRKVTKTDSNNQQEVDVTREASIQLSEKVCDSAERLRDTLIHELCHAAVWLLDGVNDGHGPRWKHWTRVAMAKLPGIKQIERCHAYTIQSRFVYRCQTCGQTVNRHSKSIDLQKMKCGLCRGDFELLVNTPAGRKRYSQAVRAPNQFAIFVKENYQSAKSILTPDRGTPNTAVHSQVMKLLSSQFDELKIKQKESSTE